MFLTGVMAIAAMTAAAAGADTVDLVASAALSCELPLTSSRDDAAPAMLADDDDVKPPFGEMGSTRWNLYGGGGPELQRDGNAMGLLAGGLSYFLVDNLSLDFELNGVYFSEDGNDAAAGIGGNLLLRWHFRHEATWSLYVDGGAGMMWTSEQVPSGGSEFNFTPQIGIGATWELQPNVRLMLGARFHHLSNANLNASNPGDNHALLYIGVTWPY